jgi:sugar lactone lactonase YvrE
MNQVKVFSRQRSQLAECPLWEPREQALYWIDIAGRAVHRQRLDDSAQTSWKLPSEPGCIARAEDGLVVAMRTGIVLLDTRSGSITQLAAAPYDIASQRFNDGRCDAHGRLWVGTIHEPRDGPRATLYCFEDGRLRDVGLPVTVSNGLAFAPDGHTLYHADTTAHAVRAYPYSLASGTLEAGRLFHQFDAQRGPDYCGRPDGATVDREGNYWLAMYEGGRVLQLSAGGEILSQHLLPVRCPTMPALGGEDMRTLFVTSVSQGRPDDELAIHPHSGHVLCMQAPVAGLPEPLCQL